MIYCGSARANWHFTIVGRPDSLYADGEDRAAQCSLSLSVDVIYDEDNTGYFAACLKYQLEVKLVV